MRWRGKTFLFASAGSKFVNQLDGALADRCQDLRCLPKHAVSLVPRKATRGRPHSADLRRSARAAGLPCDKGASPLRKKAEVAREGADSFIAHRRRRPGRQAVHQGFVPRTRDLAERGVPYGSSRPLLGISSASPILKTPGWHSGSISGRALLLLFSRRRERCNRGVPVSCTERIAGVPALARYDTGGARQLLIDRVSTASYSAMRPCFTASRRFSRYEFLRYQHLRVSADQVARVQHR